MTYRIRTLAAVAATLSASLLAAPSAHAEDQRPCVSKREYSGTDMDQRITRGELEERWDVRGLGVRVAPDQWNYRACGYGANEVQVSIVTETPTSLRVSSLDLRVVIVVRARAETISAHGHPRLFG